MNYIAEISKTIKTHSGNPSITWRCSDCKTLDFYIGNHLYIACLINNPRKNLEAALTEFLKRLNDNDLSLFKKESTSRKIFKNRCNCDPKVKSLDRARSVKRAQAILDIGIAMLKEQGKI